MICTFKKVWRTLNYYLKTGDGNTFVDGCIYTNHEVHENCTVYISYCKYCSTPSISWKHGGKMSDSDKKIYGDIGCKYC